MNEYLKKFDTIKFVATWSIFKNFFGKFSFFGIQIWILNLGRFETGRTGTGPDRFPNGIFNPDWPTNSILGQSRCVILWHSYLNCELGNYARWVS